MHVRPIRSYVGIYFLHEFTVENPPRVASCIRAYVVPPLCAPGTFRLSFSAIGACRLLPSTGPCRLLPSLGLPFDDALTSSTLPSLGLPFDLRVPFALFRQSREALDTADRLASLRRGLDTTDTDSAKHRIADDVSPDFYAWVFPKCDHVAVGTGTVTAAAKPAIRRLQDAARARAIKKIAGIEELGNTRRSVVHNFLYLVAPGCTGAAVTARTQQQQLEQQWQWQQQQ